MLSVRRISAPLWSLFYNNQQASPGLIFARNLKISTPKANQNPIFYCISLLLLRLPKLMYI